MCIQNLAVQSLHRKLVYSYNPTFTGYDGSIWRIRCTKSAEFLTCEGLWPASGERILVNSFASRCDGERIRQIDLAETDVMVSFDVVSLFTNVPVDEAILVISNRIQQEETLKERTSIPIPELCHLVELCLRSTYFQFGQTFFEQVQGAAMGSALTHCGKHLHGRLGDLGPRDVPTQTQDVA